MNHERHFQQESLSGTLSARMIGNMRLDDFCMKHIAGYNPDRMEAIAVRLFVGKETLITVYALDKSRQELSSTDPEKLPVKKFKIEHLRADELFQFFSEFNFTLSTGSYDLEDMQVINT